MSPSRSDSSVENPDSPSSGPSPAPTPSPTTSSSLLFTPIPSPSPSSWETDPQSPPPPETPTWSTAAPDAPSSSGAAGASDTPSTGKGLKLSKAGLRTAVGGGFKQVCRAVASFIALEEERAAGVWEPDEEDIKDVAEPATNIVYRRLPDEAKGGDLIDVFALGMALVGYLGKNLERRARVRTALALQAQQGVQAGEDQAPPAFPGGGY